MSVFKITGTIAAIGQSQFDNHATLYAFVEIVEPSGRRVMVRNVAVGNQALSTINVGSQGEFFFDKFIVGIGRSASQLWGVKTRDGLVAFENRNFRTPFVVRHIGIGLFASLFLFGIPYVVLGLVQLAGLIGSFGAREQLLYGDDRAEAKRLRQQQAVQI